MKGALLCDGAQAALALKSSSIVLMEGEAECGFDSLLLCSAIWKESSRSKQLLPPGSSCYHCAKCVRRDDSLSHPEDALSHFQNRLRQCKRNTYFCQVKDYSRNNEILKFQASFCCMYVHLLYTGEIPDGPVTVFGSFAVEGPKRYNLQRSLLCKNTREGAVEPLSSFPEVASRAAARWGRRAVTVAREACGARPRMKIIRDCYRRLLFSKCCVSKQFRTLKVWADFRQKHLKIPLDVWENSRGRLVQGFHVHRELFRYLRLFGTN